MPIRVTCRSCGASFKVDSRHAGRRGRCPKEGCEGTYVVPQPDDDVLEELPPARGATRTPQRAAPSRKGAVAERKPRGKGRSRKSSGQWWLVGGGAALALTVVALLFVWRSSAVPVVAAVAPASGSSVPGEAAIAPISFETEALPFIKKHCLDCHGADEPEAGISFASFSDERSMLKQRKLFERVVDLIEQGVMPPADAPQPVATEKEPVLAYLNHALFYVDCTAKVDPGRVTIRRLNRAEYNNTVRDLVGVNFQPAAEFPADDVGYGFDNIGDVLSLPPLLMEKYLDASEEVARSAIVAVDAAHPKTEDFSEGRLIRGPACHDFNDGVIIVSTGHVSVDFDAPLAGEYLVKVRTGGQRAGKDLPRMELRLGDKAMKTFEVEALHTAPKDVEMKLTLPRGKQRITAAFTNDFYDEKNKADRNLVVLGFSVVGPLSVQPSDLPPFQQMLIGQRPSSTVSTNVAVRSNLRPFLRRAFRRAVSEAELDPYVKLVEQALTEGELFDSAMQRALTAILVSPHFLFRVETDQNPHDPKDTHALNDFELASRLSYFLWSSMPDEELLAVAERNELHRDDVLEREVKRMLGDPRSRALVDNFVEQWLQLRILNDLRPDPQRFPDFNAELRADMQEETRRLLEHIIRNDRSLLDVLNARYSFVNERLAKHYGMPGVTGSEFREVSLEGKPRVGLLTHASVMTMTSNPTRTSPVKRGKWIMDVILNTPPPPPPPNVPELEAAKGIEGLPFRKQLEVHRQNPTCASCHRVMDELGFGLENFDAIGRHRETDGPTPLDVTGELPDGARFTGPQQLAGVLQSRPSEFARGVSDKLLTYALGRGLEYYDRCTVNLIADQVQAGEFRFSSLVLAIVRSEAFRMRRGDQPEAPKVADSHQPRMTATPANAVVAK